MDLKIASFNVKNLNTTNTNDAEYKDRKCKMIADIIRNHSVDLILLQEIQTADTVRNICNSLGNNYDCIHCDPIYIALNELGMRNRNDAKYKSDYGYIWNTQKLSLIKDQNLYQGIRRQTTIHWNNFLDRIVEIILAALRTVSDLELVSSMPWLSHINQQMCGDRKEFLKRMLSQTLRPPLVACFAPASFWTNLFFEFRMINTHTQWSVNKKIDNDTTSMQIRQAEMKFIQGEMHTAVNTYRTGNFKAVYTLIAGDFNMRLYPLNNNGENDISPIYNDLDFLKSAETHRMVTYQTARSTCKWDTENRKIQFINNYDHVAYDNNHIETSMINVDEIGLLKIKNWEKEFVANNKTISDHVPICLTFHI